MTKARSRLSNSLCFIALSAFSASAQSPVRSECSDAAAGPTKPVVASSANRFLNSLGVNLHIDQGYDAKSYIEPLRYLGVRQARDGSRNPGSIIAVSRATGVRFSLIAGGNMDMYLSAARSLANTGALLAIEGPNEPNNFAINYNGKRGGQSFGWSAVAEYQRDLYSRAKDDPILRQYPVFAPSEVGAETANVGLQFLRIPEGAKTAFPAGTKYADFANVHNYVSGVHGGYGDNQAWFAADPVLRGRWDGLSGNNGTTWHRKFPGYPDDELRTLPRVTTETGYAANDDPREQRLQGIVLINNYIAQFSRGWAYTFIYELRDNEGGGSLQGLYAGGRPKLAARYIHNMTSIMSDDPNQPDTTELDTTVSLQTASANVHALDLVKSSGRRILALWGESVTGSTSVNVRFGAPTAVNVYDVELGSVLVYSSDASTSLCVDISDHLMMLERPR